MRRTIDDFLSARSATQIALISLLLVTLVGAGDHAAGLELSFPIAYLMPVALSAWYAGRTVALPICLVSAATALLVNSSEGQVYSSLWIPYWGASIRLVIFAIVAELVGRLHAALTMQSLLAHLDGLTGLLNLRAFKQRYESLAVLANRYERSMAIGYLDLDGFKGINDSLGHAAGDQVLLAVAGALTHRVRASDCVARIGGDEFVVLLAETDAAGARALFTDMRRNLLDLAAANRWPLGFSIGVVVLPSPLPSAEDAIKRADDLMYKVKGGGKNDLVLEEAFESADARADASASRSVKEDRVSRI